MPIPRPLGQSPFRSLRHHQHHQHHWHYWHYWHQPALARQGGAARWASQQSRGQPQQNKERESQEGQVNSVEGLPAPGEGIRLDVSGEGSSVSLGHLGPLVVNRDGTTGRVSNWETMTAHEKDTTLALLKKRNKARLDALKKDEETAKS